MKYCALLLIMILLVSCNNPAAATAFPGESFLVLRLLQEKPLTPESFSSSVPYGYYGKFPLELEK
jgi:hypothetical protein